ncbi:hypothetical protein SK128_001422 [Halocaridina rubra]|uniref:Uncharacterized protein n=1 Tax=Halocaridina rubra TaxID=373956 RepID=A0AAN8XFJ9_HALRR
MCNLPSNTTLGKLKYQFSVPDGPVDMYEGMKGARQGKLVLAGPRSALVTDIHNYFSKVGQFLAFLPRQ